MQKTVLIQTRGVNSKLKEAAEKAAAEQGFNSLQDAIRIFIAQLANGKVEMRINSTGWSITPEMERDYENDYVEYVKQEKKGRKAFASTKKMIDSLSK